MPDERLSMADQLEATWTKMEEAAPEPVAQEPVEETPVETEEAKAERLRDEAGRFKAEDKPREKLTLKPKQEREAASAESGKDTGKGLRDAAGGNDPANGQGGGNGQGAPILPPSNWSGKGKVQWERLHHDLKVELSQELKTAAETSQKYQGLAPAIEHFAPALTERFGDVGRGLGSVLNIWQQATSSPQGAVAFVRNFMQEYRIDPQTLGFAAPASQDPSAGVEQGQLPPEVQQRLAAIESRFEQEAQERAIQQQNQITADIQAFGNETDKSSGSLAHPYFNDVRKQMGVMMAGGLAATLQEAYDQACWAVPSIRAELQREADRKAADQRKQAVAKAQLAGGSVTGSPGVARSEAHVSQSVRADLLKNWDAQEARV
jgi:hypothetical protein